MTPHHEGDPLPESQAPDLAARAPRSSPGVRITSSASRPRPPRARPLRAARLGRRAARLAATVSISTATSLEQALARAAARCSASASRTARPGRRCARHTRSSSPGARRRAGRDVLQFGHAADLPHHRGRSRRSSSCARARRTSGVTAGRGASRSSSSAAATTRELYRRVLEHFRFAVDYDDARGRRGAHRRGGRSRARRTHARVRSSWRAPCSTATRAPTSSASSHTDGRGARRSCSRSPIPRARRGRRGAAHRRRGQHRVQLRALVFLRRDGARRARWSSSCARSCRASRSPSSTSRSAATSTARPSSTARCSNHLRKTDERFEIAPGPARHGDERVHAPGLRHRVQGDPRPLRLPEDRRRTTRCARSTGWCSATTAPGRLVDAQEFEHLAFDRGAVLRAAARRAARLGAPRRCGSQGDRVVIAPPVHRAPAAPARPLPARGRCARRRARR